MERQTEIHLVKQLALGVAELSGVGGREVVRNCFFGPPGTWTNVVRRSVSGQRLVDWEARAVIRCAYQLVELDPHRSRDLVEALSAVEQ